MAISVVQTKTLNASSGSLAAATTAGNCLAVCVMSKNVSGAASVSGITLGGSADNFASLVAAHENSGAGAFDDAFIWADPGCAGGQTAIAISGSNLGLASGTGGVVIYEASGLAASSVLDVSHSGNGVTAAWSSGTTATTTQASELWVGCAANGQTGLSGPGAPWNNTTPGSTAAIAGQQVVSATGTATYNSTGASTIAGWAAVVATLKGATSSAISLPVAQVTVAALPPVPTTLLALPVAQVTVAAFGPTPGQAVPLPVARVTVAALPPGLPLPLARAQVTVTAWPPAVSSHVQLVPAAVSVTAWPPKLPRRLLVAIASAGGTDDYGNTFVQGIQVGDGTSPQIDLRPGSGGGASELQFPIPAQSPALFNEPNIAAGIGAAVELLLSGPALGVTSFKDWVQQVLFSNDGSGTPARMEFRYVSDAQAVTITAEYDSAGWVFNSAVECANGLVVNGNPVTFNQQLTVNANTFINGALDSDSGAFFTDGSGNLTMGNALILTPKMATPPNTAAVKAGTATLAQTEACLGALIQSMQNRGMIS